MFYVSDNKSTKVNIFEMLKQSAEKSGSTCLHENCPLCDGTGKKFDGSSCIHMISCNCPKCSVYC